MILPTKSGISKKNREKNFIEQANDPSQWKSRAFDLNYAADVLWKIAKPHEEAWGINIQARFLHSVGPDNEPEWVKLIHPIILLKGYAIENLVKSLYVKQKRESGETICEDDFLFKHIDLDLCEKSVISLSETEKNVVERLRHYVIWAGRYHIPKNTQKDFVPCFMTNPDLEIINSLIHRLISALEQ